MWGLFGCLVLAKSSHTSVVELTDPFGKNHGFVGARYIKARGPSLVGFVFLRAIGVKDFVMLDTALQHLDLGAESHYLPVIGFLGLTDSANSSAQYSPESGSIEGRDISEEIIQ